MTSIVDLWRASDPDARLVSGSVDLLSRPVRGVARTRAAPPHFPALGTGHLLVADASVVPARLDDLARSLDEAALEPCAVWVVGEPVPRLERGGGALPVIAGAGTPARIAATAGDYLDHESERLAAVSVQTRLAGAEAALGDPRPGAPAGMLATRLRRGVAVTLHGSLAAVNPRPAGTALATRFAAAHHRLLVDRQSRPEDARRTRDGLWILERVIGADASAWLFDDLPFAAIDRTALDALAVTLRALQRRPVEQAIAGNRTARVLPPSTGDPLHDTLLAVARANGRIAPAARVLGVHRNTVLYRLRRASADLGIDPRRPEDALRLLDGTPRRP